MNYVVDILHASFSDISKFTAPGYFYLSLLSATGRRPDGKANNPKWSQASRSSGCRTAGRPIMTPVRLDPAWTLVSSIRGTSLSPVKIPPLLFTASSKFTLQDYGGHVQNAKFNRRHFVQCERQFCRLQNVLLGQQFPVNVWAKLLNSQDQYCLFKKVVISRMIPA